MSTVSKLASGIYIAAEGNYEHGRAGQKICKFTPHHMAGILTGKQCAVNVFQKSGRKASANYCIGNDGDIVCNVYEEDRAYTSSSRSNDRQAITVEVSNCENGGQWKISNAAWNSLVNLAVDVCQRYGFRLSYDGTPNGSLTKHEMFANTNCPGPYLGGRFPELVSTVNAILDGSKAPSPEPTLSNSGSRKVGDVVTINGVYTASNSTKKLNPAKTTGTITKIINGALNPYLLDNGNLGWVNESVIVLGVSSSNTQASKKSNEEIAAEVWAGKWGSGTERKNKLQAAGYDYEVIQNLVNKGVGKNGSAAKPSNLGKTALDIAREIWFQGKYGTGDARKKKVESMGYNYSEVQKYVNEFASGKRK